VLLFEADATMAALDLDERNAKVSNLTQSRHADTVGLRTAISDRE